MGMGTNTSLLACLSNGLPSVTTDRRTDRSKQYRYKRKCVDLVTKHLVSRRSSVRGEWRLSVLRHPRMTDYLAEGDAQLRVRLDQLVQQISAVYSHNE